MNSHSLGGTRIRVPALILTALAALVSACGGSDDAPEAPGAVSLTVPRPQGCQTADKPESGVQGQVSAALRASGFAGFNCNLTLVGQYQGEGGDWSSAAFTDAAGRRCFYHSTGFPTAFGVSGKPEVLPRVNPGVPVIDFTDASRPVRTTSLTTPAMMAPWESLKVSNRRQLLIADNGANGGGGPEIDIYDLSGDCRYPQLLASAPVGTGADGGVPGSPTGHEGNVTLDGLTYYRGAQGYDAIDISSTTKPKVIASLSAETLRGLGLGGTHGLSVSDDGNRLYVSSTGPFGVGGATPTVNGFAIFDTSEVQSRVPNPKIKFIAKYFHTDGSIAQHTIPIKVKGRPYLIQVDEAGAAGNYLDGPVQLERGCAQNVAPFGMPRIYDISDEANAKIASTLMLETNDCKNQAMIKQEVIGQYVHYASHYCSVDNKENATAMACSYFSSGIRVFDIRDPARPKEIAYFNPPATATTPLGSSMHYLAVTSRSVGADYCAVGARFDFARRQIVSMCMNNGAMALQFAPGSWPFAESTPSNEQI